MTGRVVLVVGPPLAGVDAVVGALAGLLPEHVVVGPGAGARAPDAVLAVVSAVAPMTRSDWALIERAAAGTDPLIGVVAKIDAHRAWREVLDANRALVAQWSTRGRSMPWVGVAAAPNLGAPRLGDVIALLRDRLADPAVNALRGSGFREPTRRASAGRAVELKTVLQRTRLGLLRVTRDRSLALRARLREDASAVPVGGIARFEAEVHEEAQRYLTELDDAITGALADAAAELDVDPRTMARPTRPPDPPDLTRPPSSSRRLEGRLMAVLGVGFGLGIALASSRLLAGLARGPSVLGLVAGLAVGVALVLWVVRVRGLLHDRALLDRWVTEVTAALRWHGEALVAERLLAAELARLGARVERGAAAVAAGAGWGPEDVTDQYEW